jgi:hypothetical protein
LVRLDGVVLRQPSLGSDLPVDPGEHVLELVIADRVLFREVLIVANGERVERVLAPTTDEQMVLAAGHTKRESAAPPRVQDPWVRQPPERDTRRPRSRFLPAAYAASGVALGGFVLAAVSGSLALHDKGVVADHCPNRRCDATGAQAAERGRDHVAMANGGMVVGVAGLLDAGALFWHALQ